MERRRIPKQETPIKRHDVGLSGANLETSGDSLLHGAPKPRPESLKSLKRKSDSEIGEPNRKRRRHDEEEYRQWLIKSQPEFQANQQKLRTYFDECSNFEDFKQRDTKFKHILIQFKQEVNYVVGKCLTSNFVVDEWKLANETYQQSLKIFETNRSSCSPEQLVDQMEQLQKAVALLADFTKAKSQEPDEVLSIFVGRIRISESGKEKQQRLQVYQQWLQGHQQKIQEFQESLQKHATLSMKEFGEKVGLLSKEIGNSIKEMIAIGHLIRKDHPQSTSQGVSDLLNTLKDDIQSYDAAVRHYNGLKQENQGLPEAQRIANTLEKLSLMIEKTVRIQQDYSKLANPDIGVQTKGKERDLFLEREALMELEEQGTPPRPDHEALQPEEDNHGPSNANIPHSYAEIESSSGSESDSSGDQSTPSANTPHSYAEIESSSGSESDSSGDQPAPSRLDTLQEQERDREIKEKRKDASDSKKVIMQMKLRIQLQRGIEYFSTEEVKEASQLLADQVYQIHQDYCGQLDAEEEKREKRTSKGLMSSCNTKIGDGEFEAALNVISRFQNYMLQKKEYVQGVFEKDDVKRFCQQVEKISQQQDFIKQRPLDELEDDIQAREHRLDVLEVDIRARELGIALRDNIGQSTYEHTTVALAYMNGNNADERKIVISINGGSNTKSIRKLIKKQKLDNESWTLASKRKDNRHAEIVLLAYAEKHNLKIVALGASRNCCGSCWEAIVENKEIITPEAVGQEKPEQLREWHPRPAMPGLGRGHGKLPRKNVDSSDSDDFDSSNESTDHDDKKLVEKSSTPQDHPQEKTHEKDLPDWVQTDEDREKIKNAIKKGINELLGTTETPHDINVNSLLGHISIFQRDKIKQTGITTNHSRFAHF